MFILLVVLPLFFALFISLISIFTDNDKFFKILFSVGVFSPWIFFLGSVSDLPLGKVVGGWTRHTGVEVVLGDFNFFFVLVELIVFSLVAIYSINYFSSSKSNKVFMLLLLMHGGLLGSFISRDLFNFYVFSEIASVSGFALIGISKIKGSKKAAFRYIIFFFISSYLFLFSIGIIYSEVGYLNLNLIKQNIVMTTEIKIAVGIGFTSLILKGGIFPLYFWLPDAHAKAQTPVSALLSGIMVKASIYGMLLFLIYFPIEFLGSTLKIVAFSSMLFGMVLAIFQTDAKKLLAYSTVSQLGFVLLGVATMNIQGAVFHSFAHGLTKSGLFLGVGMLIHKQGTRDLRELSYNGNVILILSIFILSLGIGGISPFIGGYSKGLLLSNIGGNWVYLFYLVSIGTLLYYFKLNFYLLNVSTKFKLNLNKSLIPFISAIFVLGFGLYFKPAIKILDFVLIVIAILIFSILYYLKVFELKIPTVKSYLKSVGEENNIYAAIYVTFLILVLLKIF